MSKPNSTGGGKVVVSRLLAAFIPGFILTNSLGIFFVLALPIDRMASIPWVMAFAFLVYTFIVMWVFHVPSVKRVWAVLLSGIVLTSAANAAMVFMGAPA